MQYYKFRSSRLTVNHIFSGLALRILRVGAVAVASFSLVACNFEETKSPKVSVDPMIALDQPSKDPAQFWPDVEALLLKPSCASCHSGTRPASGISLASAENVKAIMAREPSFVVNGNPDGSTLYTIIASGRMPPSGRSVNEAGLTALREWIVALGSPRKNSGDVNSGGTKPTPPGATPSASPSPTAVPTPSPTPVPCPSQSPNDDHGDDHGDDHEIENGADDCDKPTDPVTDPVTDPGAAAPTWADINSKLIGPANCLMCHEGEFANAAVDLVSYQSTMSSKVDGDVNRPVVQPNSPATSRLLQVLKDGSMPPGGPAPSAEVISLVEIWITKGAL